MHGPGFAASMESVRQLQFMYLNSEYGQQSEIKWLAWFHGLESTMQVRWQLADIIKSTVGMWRKSPIKPCRWVADNRAELESYMHRLGWNWDHNVFPPRCSYVQRDVCMPTGGSAEVYGISTHMLLCTLLWYSYSRHDHGQRRSCKGLTKFVLAHLLEEDFPAHEVLSHAAESHKHKCIDNLDPATMMCGHLRAALANAQQHSDQFMGWADALIGLQTSIGHPSQNCPTIEGLLGHAISMTAAASDLRMQGDSFKVSDPACLLRGAVGKPWAHRRNLPHNCD